MAKLYQLRGIAHYYLGNYDQELANHQEGLRIAEKMDKPGLQGELLLELSMSANRQQELQQSIHCARRAIDLCQEAKQLDCLATAQRNLGRTYLKTGQRDSAMSLLNASLEVRQEINDSIGISYGLNDMAQLATENGNTTKAIEYLEASSAIRSALGDSSGLAIVRPANDKTCEITYTFYDSNGKALSSRKETMQSLIANRYLRSWSLMPRNDDMDKLVINSEACKTVYSCIIVSINLSRRIKTIQ